MVPTLIQEAGADARPIEDKRAELAALPAEEQLSEADVEEIRRIGDNSGCMALKGASPEHEGDALPDRWGLDDELAEAGSALEHRPRARPAKARPPGPGLRAIDGIRLWLATGRPARYRHLAAEWVSFIRQRGR